MLPQASSKWDPFIRGTKHQVAKALRIQKTTSLKLPILLTKDRTKAAVTLRFPPSPLLKMKWTGTRSVPKTSFSRMEMHQALTTYSNLIKTQGPRLGASFRARVILLTELHPHHSLINSIIGWCIINLASSNCSHRPPQTFRFNNRLVQLWAITHLLFSGRLSPKPGTFKI